MAALNKRSHHLNKSRPQNFALICVKSRKACPPRVCLALDKATEPASISRRTHAQQLTASLLDHFVGESCERKRKPQGLKPNVKKSYSVSMTTCSNTVKKEAPNIATKPSMATSNTVSSVPIIQSIISRIGAPVILTIKLDRLCRGSRSPLIRFAPACWLLVDQHATGNGTNFPVPMTL